MDENLRKVRARTIAAVMAAVVAILVITSALLVARVDQETQSRMLGLVSADTQQLQLNISTYLHDVETTADLMFERPEYYTFDATDPSLGDYARLQGEKVIRDRIVDIGLMKNFSDFGVVYANDEKVGWVSQVTSGLFPNGGMYDEFASRISNEGTQSGWTYGVGGNKDRVWFVKRLNDHALIIQSFYSRELSDLFEQPDELHDVSVRLVDQNGTILYSKDSDEIGSALPDEVAGLAGDGDSVQACSNDMMVSSSRCSNGWRVVCSVPVSKVMQSTYDLRTFVILLVVAALALSVVAVTALYDRMNASVDTMVDSLNRRASHDQLSGLLNKITYETLVQARVRELGGSGEGEAQRGLAQAPAVAYAIVDMDDFKSVNDTMGHARGDEAIERVGRALRDTFGGDSLVGRIGGDEFSVFVEHGGEDEAALRRSVEEAHAGFVEALAREFAASEWDGPAMTASVGVAIARADEVGFDELYRRADEALYQSKHAGKNRLTTLVRMGGEWS